MVVPISEMIELLYEYDNSYFPHPAPIRVKIWGVPNWE